MERTPETSAPTGGLLVVHHSRTGSTEELTDAAVDGASAAVGEQFPVRVHDAFEASADEVLRAQGVLIATPA